MHSRKHLYRVPLFIDYNYSLQFCFRSKLRAYTTLKIHSRMVRDVRVPALAVSSTIHHGSVAHTHPPFVLHQAVIINYCFVMGQL